MIRNQITKFTKILCHEKLELYSNISLQSDRPELAVFNIVKKVLFCQYLFLFHFQG